MATHSSILAWRIPWTLEAGGLQSTASQRVGHVLATKQQQCQESHSWLAFSRDPLTYLLTEGERKETEEGRKNETERRRKDGRKEDR